MLILDLPASLLKDLMPHLNMYYLDRIEKAAHLKGKNTQTYREQLFCSQDRLWIHRYPDQEKVFTENESMRLHDLTKMYVIYIYKMCSFCHYTAHTAHDWLGVLLWSHMWLFSDLLQTGFTLVLNIVTLFISVAFVLVHCPVHSSIIYAVYPSGLRGKLQQVTKLLQRQRLRPH